jgi:hypothetical protein
MAGLFARSFQFLMVIAAAAAKEDVVGDLLVEGAPSFALGVERCSCCSYDRIARGLAYSLGNALVLLGAAARHLLFPLFVQLQLLLLLLLLLSKQNLIALRVVQEVHLLLQPPLLDQVVE